MPASVVEGYPNERSNDFFGKDSLTWWIGEVENNEDPLNIGRVKCRILGWYTNPSGDTMKDLPTDDLPWALVLQPTTQAGNDGQGESSGQLQPGAIVMGFFFDGEEGQQPVVMGVLRVVKGEQSRDKPFFVLTGESNQPYTNTTTAPAGQNTTTGPDGPTVANQINSVQLPNQQEQTQPNPGNPNNAGNVSQASPQQTPPMTPVPAADGTGGPAKTLKMHLTNIVNVAAQEVAGLVKVKPGVYKRLSDNVPVAIDKITAAIKNAIMAIAAQVVAAMREWLNELAGLISKGVGLIASFTGISAATMVLIKTAIELILKQLCILDNNIVKFALNPIKALEALLDAAIGKAMEAVSLATQMLDELADKLKSAFGDLMCKMKSIINAVEAILALAGAAIAIINTWKEGKKILNEKLDLRKLTLDDFLNIIIMLLNMFDLGCGRSRQNSKNKAFVPILGATYCVADDDGSSIAARLGAPACSDSGTGNAAIDLVSSIYANASPYLTSATTWMDGGWQAHYGTPGNQMTQTRSASGRVDTSVNQDAAEAAKAAAKKDAAAKGITDSKKIQAAADKAAKGATAPVVGDHTSFPGAYTVDVTKDLCYQVKGDEIHTVHGDYRLKVTGNFHLEVGGALFINAVGAPQVEAGEKGTGGAGKAQKHSIVFGSDADISTSGATLKVNATELNLNSMSTNLGAPTGTLAIDSPSVNIRGGDIVLTASNTISTTAISQLHLVNSPPTKATIKSGITTTCFGPIDTVLLPALSGDGVIPKYTVTNTKGPGIFTFADLGCSFTIPKGMFQVGVAVGAIKMQAAAGAVDISAGATMTLSAKGAVIITGKTISLN